MAFSRPYYDNGPFFFFLICIKGGRSDIRKIPEMDHCLVVVTLLGAKSGSLFGILSTELGLGKAQLPV
jgi:hypothetical protein